MKPAGWIRSAYLTRFSQPVQDRPIYQTLFQRRVQSILEIGMAQGLRTGRMLEAALRKDTPPGFRYIGIDLFEARERQQPGLSIKQAHRLLAGWGIHTRLIPGDPHTALSQAANSLGPVDLVVISADVDAESMSRAWFYLPRLLQRDSRVFVEEMCSTGRAFRALTADVIAARAREADLARRRAA